MAILGIDLGTSSVKVTILDEQGYTLAAEKASYPVLSQHPGWAESNPADWWEAVSKATRNLLARLPDTKINALGLSGQMHGVVLVDDENEPVRPALLWPDVRAVKELELFKALSPESRQRLANPLVPGMAGPLLCWLAINEPESYRRIHFALSPKDWLRLRLTGSIATDPGDASATLLYDLLSNGWAEEVIQTLGLNRAIFPAILPSGSIAGNLTTEAATSLGLPSGLPVATGTGDTPAALLGSGMLLPGKVQLTIGTGAQLVQVLNTPAIDPTGRTHLYCTVDRDRWYSMAAVQNAGLALEWVKGMLMAGWQELYGSLESVLPGCEKLYFLPYLTVERAHQPYSKQGGAFLGLRPHHTREHLLRASLEGVAYGIRAAFDTLPGIDKTNFLQLAGGGSVPKGWRQLLADVLNRELHLVETADVSARGAALLAGIATGIWENAAATLPLAPAISEIAVPDRQKVILYEELYRRFRSLSDQISPYQ